ncbi:uncharacterized protein LOC117113752 [Anneissia japonica]|uniref:uncharacterized protein LOC117113752 n=1 Tax=Anneissia japonica TaxID=1529436 RepID=UPI0014258BCB|nr:uncharacterized protein LOC117113752 [Anneissia japonica]
MDDRSAEDKTETKSFVIDINVKYQFSGTENDIEGLKNDEDYLKNICSALLPVLNKKTGSDKSETSSAVSVTAVSISNATSTDVHIQSLNLTTTQEQPMSDLKVLATATELQQTKSSESSMPHVGMRCAFTKKRPASDNIESSQTTPPSISSVSAIKSQTEHQGARTNKCVNVRSRLRPIAIKPLPPTIYGHTSANGSQPFVPIVLKQVRSSFALVPQTQLVSTVESSVISKPTPCSQPISPQTSKFIAQHKSFLSEQHTFRPVKPNELLLDLYEQHLDLFAGTKYSRTSLWEKVASIMVEQGYSVTGPQCNNRWRYLLATFNKVATSDSDSNSFKYFNRIAEILHKKSTMPVTAAKTPGVIAEAMLEVLGDKEEGRPVVKKRRRRKEDEKDELIATLSKKMEQLQEMQNEMTTFLSAFKDGIVKKQ